MSTHFPGARLDHVFWEETSGPAVSDSSSGESPAPTEERVGWAALQRQMSPIPATAGLLQGWPEQLALSAGNGSSEVEVVPFQQVWGRSYCRALEKLVDVLSEYPDEVEHMFNPSCVSLLRCSGCCGDENLHCMPVETANVTMQASNPSLPEAPDDPFYGPALLRGADLLSAHPLSVQASVGGYEARKEETQGQGEEEEREAETHRLPPVRPYCSPEVTGPSEERRLAPAPVFITATLSYLPADTCPLFISQLYPC
ncbi:placenta growth factor isoform X2 [Canis lupus familiaris]|uniref:placenta growth factor isoform X2 n=1 Tax=Canis lupus familiaris TaxID=9615 RepID=UPI000BA9FAA9|nr:placenta growth factor isoform X2 [Canis lupus familiaris]XP_038401215.1 placenta growth factor isoform X2 [Canis lupus familiaris]XP_038530136.1 placenta growth factor isoform X2 [Canis lupus familiaris]|eukprot:XP_022277929.1 placenta growth factor isoform X2 [Canis lupus familiaris]